MTTIATDFAEHLRDVARFMDSNPSLPAPDVSLHRLHWHLTDRDSWRDDLRQITADLECKWVVSELGTCHSLSSTTGTRLGDVVVFVPLTPKVAKPHKVDLSEFKVANR